MLLLIGNSHFVQPASLSYLVSVTTELIQTEYCGKHCSNAASCNSWSQVRVVYMHKNNRYEWTASTAVLLPQVAVVLAWDLVPKIWNQMKSNFLVSVLMLLP